MNSLAKKIDEDLDYRADKIWFEDDFICVQLIDGRRVQVPLDFYPTLSNASCDARNEFELFGEGTAIHFTHKSIDDYLSINSLVLGLKQMDKVRKA